MLATFRFVITYIAHKSTTCNKISLRLLREAKKGDIYCDFKLNIPLKPSNMILSVLSSWFPVWLTSKEIPLFHPKFGDNRPEMHLKVSPGSDEMLIQFSLWCVHCWAGETTSKKCVISSHDNLPRFRKHFYVFFIERHREENLGNLKLTRLLSFEHCSTLASDHRLEKMNITLLSIARRQLTVLHKMLFVFFRRTFEDILSMVRGDRHEYFISEK